MVSGWFFPIIGSALTLGFYDVCKKHAVRENSVMPVLFLTTFFGSAVFLAACWCTGKFATALVLPRNFLILVWLKSLLVSCSWVCVYYALRDLPISIASPIRSSAPLWTFIGGLILYREIPTLPQAFAMLIIFAGYAIFSLVGKMEGFSFAYHRSVHLILLGTLLGSASALYDKYLLNVLHVPVLPLQLHFNLDLIAILGLACLIRMICSRKKLQFRFRWSIPCTGILLNLADYLYFCAVSLPDTQISILSLMRRCGVVVAFAFGAWVFHDKHIRIKAMALGCILLGVILLALMK